MITAFLIFAAIAFPFEVAGLLTYRVRVMKPGLFLLGAIQICIAVGGCSKGLEAKEGMKAEEGITMGGEMEYRNQRFFFHARDTLFGHNGGGRSDHGQIAIIVHSLQNGPMIVANDQGAHVILKDSRSVDIPLAKGDVIRVDGENLHWQRLAERAGANDFKDPSTVEGFVRAVIERKMASEPDKK